MLADIICGRVGRLIRRIMITIRGTISPSTPQSITLFTILTTLFHPNLGMDALTILQASRLLMIYTKTIPALRKTEATRATSAFVGLVAQTRRRTLAAIRDIANPKHRPLKINLWPLRRLRCSIVMCDAARITNIAMSTAQTGISTPTVGRPPICAVTCWVDCDMALGSITIALGRRLEVLFEICRCAAYMRDCSVMSRFTELFDEGWW